MFDNEDYHTEEEREQIKNDDEMAEDLSKFRSFHDCGKHLLETRIKWIHRGSLRYDLMTCGMH